MLATNYFIAQPHDTIRLKDYATDFTGQLQDKAVAKEVRKGQIERLKQLQALLYADKRYALLLIFQGIDASGKDSTIKHVMSGVNPQGCRVVSFAEPSDTELQHDFLWRTYRELPAKGKIGIFNRSYYEEVIITRVHPELLLQQHLPGIHRKEDIGSDFWENRFRSINDIERHLHASGTIIMKFFLHLSYGEQKKRFLKRINRPEKNWKLTLSDIEERKYWEDYQQAFEGVINHTSTSHAPWYIVPADHKWYMRTLVSRIIVDQLEKLDLRFPSMSNQQKENLQKARQILEDEP
ncbi:MAG: polyphosphate kinase 2 family protein [Cyclobacteriaceae bacterium]